MISQAFTIYDSKAEAYLSPFFMQSKGQALRAFQDAAQDKETQFAKHPSDFTLFEIGEYDDSTGIFTQYENKTSLGLAIEFIKE